MSSTIAVIYYPKGATKGKNGDTKLYEGVTIGYGKPLVALKSAFRFLFNSGEVGVEASIDTVEALLRGMVSYVVEDKIWVGGSQASQHSTSSQKSSA